MKKLLSIFCALCFTVTCAQAQWIRVWNGGESTRHAITDANTIPYTTAGSTLTIDGTSYSTAAIDSITIVNPVIITYSGNTASVDIPETAEGVTAEVNGADVVINNACTNIEHEFLLQGSTTTGSLTYYGEYKTKFHLNGVSITSATGAAIDIQCGKRIDLILEDGTTNSLSDAANGEQRAAFNCQGHLEVSGAGTLNIAGNSRHALRSNEYLFLKKSTGAINITKAASDGIHCGEYFQQNGGTITIASTQGDGLQVETDPTSDEALNGQFIMNGGTINLTVSAQDTKGIRLDAAEATTGTEAPTPHMQILDGAITIDLTSTALGARAIASDGNLTIGSKATSPSIGITVAAGVYTDPTTSEEERATGIKADLTLTIAGGNTTVNATGTKSRGVRAATLTATGGTLTVTNTGTKSQGIKLDNTFISGQGGTVSGSFKY